MSNTFEKKFLRIVQKGFEHYTGELSMYVFEDGVSVEPIPRVERDRIAATMACVEVAENGRETTAGIAERLVEDSKRRAPVAEPSERQTEAEKESEIEAGQDKELMKSVSIYEEPELDALIKEGGIHALREVAKQWGLKGRAIPELRDKVLQAQAEFLEKHKERAAKRQKMIDTILNVPAVKAPEKPEQPEQPDDVQQAAASGDMSAAVNQKDD